MGMGWVELGLEYSGLGSRSSRTRPGLGPAKAKENILD